MTKEEIKEEFIGLLNDSYRYWTDSENAQEVIPYLTGAFDLMTRCVEKLDKVGMIDEN